MRLATLVVLGGCFVGCTPSRHDQDAPAAGLPPRFEPFLPGVDIDRAARVARFDAMVAVDAHDPATPLVYLELVACSPDTREHESLVVTDVLPSNIHAAMLALGAEPGRPGRVSSDSESLVHHPARGTALELVFRVSGSDVSPSEWVVNADTGGRWTPGAWVFAGSRVVERGGVAWYDADGAGTIIGLTSFGSEVIAPTETLSPQSGIDAPEWIADQANIPSRGTPVTVLARVLATPAD